MTLNYKLPWFEITCEEASRLLSESLDRKLSRRERWALWLHTLLCTACRKLAHQWRLIREAIAHAPATLRESLGRDAMSLSPERKLQIERLLAEARRTEARD